MTLNAGTPTTLPQDVIDLIKLGQPETAADTLARRLNVSRADAERQIEAWFWATSRLSRGPARFHKTRG